MFSFTNSIKFNLQTDICTSKTVKLSNFGWQKLDLTTTIQKWYSEVSRTTLHLLVDCSGCSNRVNVHLFAKINQPTQTTYDDNNSNKKVIKKNNANQYNGATATAATTTRSMPIKQTMKSSSTSASAGDPHRPFLVIFTDQNSMKRVRRRAIDCSSAFKGQCCKETLFVDFKELGWDDWIIAPNGYSANYCKGDCNGPRTPDIFLSYHSHIIEEYRKMNRLSGLQPCCAPIKYSSMSLIYFEENQKIVKRDLPKMVVEECGCP